MKTSKDLTKEAPRSPRHRLGGYSLMARMIDKGRASLENKAGEYHYACPLDQTLFGFKAVNADEVLALLRSGATDEEVVAWFGSHGQPKSPAEISVWSDQVDHWSLYGHPEKGGWFAEECSKLGLDPAATSLAEFLEADDAATFPAAG